MLFRHVLFLVFLLKHCYNRKLGETMIKEMYGVSLIQHLSEEEKNKIDIPYMKYLYGTIQEQGAIDLHQQKITPMESIVKDKLDFETAEKFRMLGESFIREGKLAVCSMAGGQGTRLGFHGPKGTYSLTVFGREITIFETIVNKLKEAKETAEAMADFKALAVAAEEFIAQSELGYTPISIEMPIQNAKEERYTRYLVKNLRYFRSEFLQKKSHTSEDRKRALIPDYYETKPNKDLYRDAKAILK